MPMVSDFMFFFHLQAMEKNEEMKLKELNKSLEILCPSGWDEPKSRHKAVDFFFSEP
jgi:hypothetical protein